MQQKGFFGSLFDVSFKSLAMTKIIKVLYILILIAFALAAVFLIGNAAQEGGSEALVTIIAVVLGFLLYLMYIRLGLEALIVIYNIGQNTAELVRLQGGRGSAGGLSTLKESELPPVTSGGGAATGEVTSGGGQAAGWYTDPQGQARLRYWDGSAWTEHTSD